MVTCGVRGSADLAVIRIRQLRAPATGASSSHTMSSSTTTGLSPTDVVDEDTAAATVEALLLRLRRVEFLLAGTCDDPVAELYALRQSGREHAIKPSLHALERDLSRLVSKSRTVKDILELRGCCLDKMLKTGLTRATQTPTSRRSSAPPRPALLLPRPNFPRRRRRPPCSLLRLSFTRPRRR